jgi:uncharacterized delta-60 repeat protein
MKNSAEKKSFNLQLIAHGLCKINKLNVILTTLLIFGATILTNAATGLDPAFGADGKTVINGGGEAAGTFSTALATAIDSSNGKIYAVGFGRLLSVNNTGMSFSRLNADGSPDTTYGANGRRLVAFQDNGTFFDGRGNGVIVLADGSAIGVGGVSDGSAAIVKMTPAGALDQSFGTGGAVFTTFGATGASLNAVVLMTDGNFIAVGGNSSGNFVVAKFTPNGALDASFGTGGFVTTDFNSGNDVASSVVLQPDGKIVVGGKSSNDCAVARYNTNGSLDTSFGTGGKTVTTVVSGNPDYLSKILLQTDGKIVGLGIAAATGFERHLLVRYNANGTLDNSFGTNGIAGGYFNNSQEYITGGAILPNGKIFAVGFVAGIIGTKASVTRYNADGSVDRTFLCNGFGATFFGTTTAAPSYYYAAALQTDGKVVAVGQGTSAAITTNSVAFGRYTNQNTPTQCAANDFERDGKSDLSVFRPSDSRWYLNRSSETAAYNNVQFGVSTDRLAPADYDGDGKTDIAVWRESEGNFYILGSLNNSVRVENFGLVGDKLTVGDWDGDGKADLSVYRDGGAQSYFFYRGSFNNPSGNITYLPWGTSGDKPLRGDFDADGKQDAAVYRASNQVWYIRNSSNGQAAYQTFGLSTDSFVPADYDGDGKTDIAVFRPSNSVWYILQSSNNQVRYETFGLSADNLAPADYDGDGKADVAVFRNGVWYILQSSNNQVSYQQFGLSGDKPVQTDLMP